MAAALFSCHESSCLLARTYPPFKCVLLPDMNRQRGLEKCRGDFPVGVLIGVGVAVVGDQAVEEFEQAPRNAEIAERADEAVLIDGGFEEVGECGLGAGF